jgi:hypothetical protein
LLIGFNNYGLISANPMTNLCAQDGAQTDD